MKCFLVEPIWGEPASRPDPPHTDWNPEHRKILGWKRADTGEEKEYPHMFGVGAMWRAYWLPRYWDNETEPHLMVITPSGGHWDIDGRCSNCTMIADELHRCWVRHGDAPNITVDKSGLTCSAGGGSIISLDYHGFLRDGVFT